MKLARTILDGLIAGLMGAAAVALWFLIFDTARGHPFETPALLSAVLLHGARQPVAVISARLVGEYTAVHFVAFALVGVALGVLLEAAEREAPLIVSVAIFSAGFEVFFLALVMFVGPGLMNAIAWWSILVGNLLATFVIFAYLLARHPAVGRGWLEPWVIVLHEGVLAGAIGAAIVAVWFLIYDAALAQPFRTPGLLGAAIFTGLRDPAGLHIMAAPVVGYTVLHFLAFVVFGLAAAFIIQASEREPMVLLLFFVLFACFEVVFLGIVTITDATLLESLGWWAITIGNLLAAVGMLGFFYTRHRALHVRLMERWENLNLL